MTKKQFHEIVKTNQRISEAIEATTNTMIRMNPAKWNSKKENGAYFDLLKTLEAHNIIKIL